MGLTPPFWEIVKLLGLGRSLITGSVFVCKILYLLIPSVDPAVEAELPSVDPEAVETELPSVDPEAVEAELPSVDPEAVEAELPSVEPEAGEAERELTHISEFIRKA